MKSRVDCANSLRADRKSIVRLLTLYPLEIQSDDSVPTSERFRVVIETIEELDLLIEQLEAKHVSADKALNPTLVR